MKNLIRDVLVERARPGMFGHQLLRSFVIMEDLASRQILRPERNKIVVVETVLTRRNPLKAPPHPFSESLDLHEWCVRDCDEGYVAMRQMNIDAIEVVRPERAVGTSGLPL